MNLKLYTARVKIQADVGLANYFAGEIKSRIHFLHFAKWRK